MAKIAKMKRAGKPTMKFDSKTDLIVHLARRKRGVSGTEIMDATGWPSGSAKFRVARLAESRGFEMERVDSDEARYRLVKPTV